MRVVVDLQALPGSARPHGSIDHYAASLACAILRHAGNHDVYVVINHSSEEFLEKLQGKFPDLFRKGAFRVSRLPFLDTAKADGSWHRAAAELVREHALLSLKPDVVLCASLAGAGGAVLVSHLRCTRIPTAIALSELPSAIRPETSPEQHVSTVPEPSRGSVRPKATVAARPCLDRFRILQTPAAGRAGAANRTCRCRSTRRGRAISTGSGVRSASACRHGEVHTQ